MAGQPDLPLFFDKINSININLSNRQSHFLAAMQESNQRRWHRGGADREAYRSCIPWLAYFPGFEPPSPMYPFRRWTEDCHWSIQQDGSPQFITNAGIPGYRSDSSPSFDGGRVGGWGRAAQSRAEHAGCAMHNDRLCGQRLPQPLSLVHFLCGHKK